LNEKTLNGKIQIWPKKRQFVCAKIVTGKSMVWGGGENHGGDNTYKTGRGLDFPVI